MEARYVIIKHNKVSGQSGCGKVIFFIESNGGRRVWNVNKFKTVSVLRVGKELQIECSETLPFLTYDLAEYSLTLLKGLKVLIRLYTAPPTMLGNHFPLVVQNVIIDHRGNSQTRVSVNCYIGFGTNITVYTVKNESIAIKISTKANNIFKWQVRVV